MLSEKGVKHLTLSWTKRLTDETFSLQMNDESNYFRNKYVGSSVTYTVTDLYRNTEYKFRVRINEAKRIVRKENMLNIFFLVGCS